MKEYSYDRNKAVEYAKMWALNRNKKYFDFELYGGDCTNFTSQCLLEGTGVMNYTRTFGWYYNTSYDRSPSWTGVQFFSNFILKNKSVGPFAIEVDVSNIELGDIIQVGTQKLFYHTLIVTDILQENSPSIENILVCAHSYDTYQRPLNSYIFEKVRFLHIQGYRSF